MGLVLEFEEDQTKLSEDEREGLLIKSITLHSELDEFEQLNIENAIAWSLLKKFKKETVLTEKFIKTLHKKMFGNVWKWAGEFRKSEKNIGVKWILISTELKMLFDDTLFWIENKTYSHQEIAIRFKHKLVSIHCFPNGNGRHSRLMADILIENVFKETIFSWNETNMTKPNETRKAYIDAIRDADKGNIVPLLEFASN